MEGLYPTYANDIYPSAQGIIRNKFGDSLQKFKWGLPIFRCTYTSTTQAEWDRFIALIKEDARSFLSSPEDQDLWSSMEWRVIEDPRLDGVTWREARQLFDTQVRSEILADLDNAPYRPWDDPEAVPQIWTDEDKFEHRILNDPRNEFFIFADERVVQSVLTNATTKKRPGGYFITVVETNYFNAAKEEEQPPHLRLLGGDVPEDVKDELERPFRQQFYAWDLVNVYATLLQGGWPDEFFQDPKGISQNLSI